MKRTCIKWFYYKHVGEFTGNVLYTNMCETFRGCWHTFICCYLYNMSWQIQRGIPLYIAAWANYYFMASWFFGKKIMKPLMTKDIKRLARVWKSEIQTEIFIRGPLEQLQCCGNWTWGNLKGDIRYVVTAVILLQSDIRITLLVRMFWQLCATKNESFDCSSFSLPAFKHHISKTAPVRVITFNPYPANVENMVSS